MFKEITAVQFFAILAIAVGLVVSYAPPSQNSAAIWGLVSTFFGYAMHKLFDSKDAPPPPEVSADPKVSDSQS